MRLFLQICVILLLPVAIACSPADLTQEQEFQRAEPPVQINVPESVTPATAMNEYVIIMLGDSLTAGYGLSRQQALPAQLETRLAVHDDASSIRVINAGVSGDTTANGLARFNWSVGEAQADMLIIALGANDFLIGVAPEQTKSNLAAIIEKAQAINLAVVLAGIEARSKGGAGEDYGRIYLDLATKYQVPLYPGLLHEVRSRPELLQADGLHPTARGVEVIANSLSEFVQLQLD